MVGLCSGTACQRVAEPSLASVTVIVQELWENTRRGRAHLPRLGSGLVLDGGSDCAPGGPWIHSWRRSLS